MNYRQAQIVLKIAIILVILLCAGGIYRCVRTDKEPDAPAPTEQTDEEVVIDDDGKKVDHEVVHSLSIDPRVSNLAKQFNDINDDHLQYAQHIGIKPITSTRDIWRNKKPMMKIESCEDFQVDKLTHSYPYLVEPAAQLLHDIGAEFNQELKNQGGGDYKIKVTSLLRTSESVNRLKKGNVNSTQNSAHLYGTTFDISYVDFPEGHLNEKKHTDGDLKNLLSGVLLKMKEEGRCLVKFERKQGCFHITATGK